MSVLRADVQLHRVELTVQAVIIEDFLLLSIDCKGHIHAIETNRAREKFRALVSEGGCL